MLLTGISGTGKSTLTQALARRGLRAVDADCDAYSMWVEVPDCRDPGNAPVEPGRDWVWREDRIQALLSEDAQQPLVLSGCAANMARFLPQFDYVVLLSAPLEVLAERLATRTGNAYGKQPHEAQRVLAQKETIEPLLRKRANLELDTSDPVEETVAHLLRVTLEKR